LAPPYGYITAMPDTGPHFERQPQALGLIAELRLATAFLTRLPVRLGAESAAPLASAIRAFPLVGLLIGLIAASVLLAAGTLGLPGTPAVLLALAAGTLLTGALHEDGLADTADALGARGDRERRLAVMRDSRIGAFGALALILVVALKAAALAQLPPLAAACALIAAGSTSRAAMAGAMYAVPPARRTGLGAASGRPTRARLIQTLLIALGLIGALASAAPGWQAALAASAGCVLALVIMIRVMARAFGGQTGDTLGATQQVCETATLLAIAAATGW
jgi:adenosylcobinamide-GDP ribazoletransferase